MRIAVIADMHANGHALEVIIAHALLRKVDTFWNLGDMVGYGPFPNQVIGILRSRCSRHVLGNHDIKCASPGHASRMRAAGRDRDKVFSFEWTHGVLSAENIRFIRQLPPEDLVRVKGWQILLTHGSPRGMDDCLTARTPAERFTRLARALSRRGISHMLCGHTHEFVDRTHGGVRFINPGGGGRSFDGDPRAAYCILDISPSVVRVEPYRVPYPLEKLVRAMRARRFPLRLVRTMREARSLEELDRISKDKVDALVRGARALVPSAGRQDRHSEQVARLSISLFDGLMPLHGLTWRERAYLNAAALLHDIGWVGGSQRHHKVSRDMILKDRSLPLDPSERLLVALIARYHRGPFPDEKHRFTGELSAYDRESVSVLAALLRIADGLDRSHGSLVEEIRVSAEARRIEVQIVSRHEDLAAEIRAARDKADLLEAVFGLRVSFKPLKKERPGKNRRSLQR